MAFTFFLLLPMQLFGQAKLVRKKTPGKPTMAARTSSKIKGTKIRKTKKARQEDDQKITISLGEPVVPGEFNGDLRDLPQTITQEERDLFFELRPKGEKELPQPRRVPLAGSVELETPAEADIPLAPMPTPLISFSALNFNSNGAGWPPDVVGDVGPNHYVQAVNTSIGIYNKTTGAAFTTTTFNALFTGTGTPCDANNAGDPTVVYDPGQRSIYRCGLCLDRCR